MADGKTPGTDLFQDGLVDEYLSTMKPVETTKVAAHTVEQTKPASASPEEHAAAARAAFFGAPESAATQTAGATTAPEGTPPPPEPADKEPYEKVGMTGKSVLPGFGSPGFKLFQVIVGGALLAAGLVFQFAEREAGGASFLATALLVVAFFFLGYEVLAEGLKKFFRFKWLDSDTLMTVATLGGVFVGQFPQATIAMFLYVLAGFFTSLNASHSDALFGALEDFEVDEVYVARLGRFVAVPPEEVQVGETILVRKHELVPIDGNVAGGSALLNTVLLSGESTPRYVYAGDRVSAGMVVASEELQLQTTATFEESTAQKIEDFLYDDSADESREGEFERKFANAFGVVVLLLGLALGIVPSVLTGEWSSWMRIAFTFMMLAGTGELLVQGPLCFENGLGTAFYNGVVVRGDGPLEAISTAEKVVFNKTGTLTRGEPEVIDIIPAEGYRAAQLLEIAAKAEALSDHRIAACIGKAYGKRIDYSELRDFSEVPGEGVVVYVNGNRLVAGNARCMEGEGLDVRESHQAGSKLHVAANGRYLGCIVTSDTVRPDSAETVRGLHELGVDNVTMLTGGTRSTSKLVAEELEVDEFGSELGPEEKLNALQSFAAKLSKKGTILFVGDGVKDARLLHYADAGIALGGYRTDEVYDLADAVIIPETPSRMVNLIRTAKRTFRYAKMNTILTIVLKSLVMVLAVVGLAGLWVPPIVTLVSAALGAWQGRNIRRSWGSEPKHQKKK